LARNLEFTIPTAEMLAKMYIKNPPYVDKNRDEVRATPIKNIMPGSYGDSCKANDESIGSTGEGYIITKARI
jgi:hypothetical protein